MKRSIKSRLEFFKSKVKEMCPSICISECNQCMDEVLESRFKGIKKYLVIWGDQTISTKGIAILPVPDSDRNHIVCTTKVNYFLPCGILRNVLTEDVITMFRTSMSHPHGIIGGVYDQLRYTDREMFTWLNELLKPILPYGDSGDPTYMVKILSEKYILIYPLIIPRFLDHLEFELKEDNILMRVLTNDDIIVEEGISLRGFFDLVYGKDYSSLEEGVARHLLNSLVKVNPKTKITT